MDSDSEDESFDMPPDFEEGMKFKHWCHELRIWRSSTDIQTNKHAPLIMLSCFGQNRRAKLAVSTLSKTAICSDNGVTNILDKLQDVFYDGELDFNKKEESEISTTCASISVMENNNNVVLCTQVAECQNRVLEYVTADNCTSSVMKTDDYLQDDDEKNCYDNLSNSILTLNLDIPFSKTNIENDNNINVNDWMIEKLVNTMIYDDTSQVNFDYFPVSINGLCNRSPDSVDNMIIYPTTMNTVGHFSFIENDCNTTMDFTHSNNIIELSFDSNTNLIMYNFQYNHFIEEYDFATDIPACFYCDFQNFLQWISNLFVMTHSDINFDAFLDLYSYYPNILFDYVMNKPYAFHFGKLFHSRYYCIGFYAYDLLQLLKTFFNDEIDFVLCTTYLYVHSLITYFIFSHNDKVIIGFYHNFVIFAMCVFSSLLTFCFDFWGEFGKVQKSVRALHGNIIFSYIFISVLCNDVGKIQRKAGDNSMLPTTKNTVNSKHDGLSLPTAVT